MSNGDGQLERRKTGRPRREIDLEKVADAVARLVEEGGYEHVSIERAANELSVSRATLYRTVPSKEHLLAILFKRMFDGLVESAREVAAEEELTPAERLTRLVHIQVEGAIEARHYLFVFFSRGWLPEESYEDWRRFRREYEDLWVEAVTEAMDAGHLPPGDPVVATRLLLGMCIWVSRWYRPEEGLDADDIAGQVLQLLGGLSPVRPA